MDTENGRYYTVSAVQLSLNQSVYMGFEVQSLAKSASSLSAQKSFCLQPFLGMENQERLR